MSFYSSLVLAANDGVRTPEPGEVHALFVQLGLIDPIDSERGGCTVSDAVSNLFLDPVARAENDRFFSPSEIEWSEEVNVMHPDGTYEGLGWSIRIHGCGYFWPWELTDLRDRVIQSPILTRLREALEGRFGGRFVFPAADAELLRSRLIDGSSDWVWLSSEDV
jgi:hypothetical protein